MSPDAPSGATYLEQLTDLALASGLERFGAAPAEPLERARRIMHGRVTSGLVDGMRFTYNNIDRSTDPAAHVPGARSVLVGARSYDVQQNDAPVDGPSARVARYAWLDHYAELKRSLTVVAGRLRSDGHRAVVFADDNSVVDREVAWLAGIGWYGKNANILLPGAGSFFVLGCIVTTADVPAAQPVVDGCGTCDRCIPACPTGAITAPGVIDAGRCLSWMLQKPGVFPREHRAALGDRIYGCDDCQTACPFTRRRVATETGLPTESAVDVLSLLTADDAEVMRRCDRWWVHGRDATWVRRNLLIVLGNTADPADPRVVGALAGALAHPRAEVRAHAVWAAARLGLRAMLPAADPDAMVRDELAHLPPLREPA
ncbi:MAG: tRNA epoxyqueuosine(34) reductase QueG [Actinomycetota bacterium]